MKYLILIRHGKSSWDTPSEDFERDLTSKGIENSTKVAKNSLNFINPDAIIWSSYAKRAYETAKIFAKNWNFSLDRIEIKKGLYTFDSFKLEQIVKSCPNDYENLILFGHNSAITDFVNKFGTTFIDNVPTSGFVSIIFETDSWSKISKGKTDKILFPRDI
jgi:phosphohistidine phosphatase